MFREKRFKNKKKLKEADRKDPVRSHRPDLPVTGPGERLVSLIEFKRPTTGKGKHSRRTNEDPCDVPWVRENVINDVLIGYASFAPDWFTGWLEISKPIAECGKAKPKQF